MRGKGTGLRASRAGTSAYLAIVRQIMAMQGRGITSQVDQSGFAIAHSAAARGETAFLHVKTDNEAARKAYLRLGFQDRRTIHLRVLKLPVAD